MFAFLLFVPILAVFGAGGREIAAPVVELGLPEVSYISPAASPGVQDELSWDASITPSERMVVKGYRIVVSDGSGNDVYRFEEINPARQSIFFYRLKQPVALPETMRWPGTTTNGSAAPEGTYEVVVEGIDDKDRVGSSAAYRVIVDNTPPSGKTSLPYTVFSPNADGNQGILVVEQSGTVEPKWTGSFVDSSGQTVFSNDWTNGSPDNLIWTGTGTDGDPVSDGRYEYRHEATDLAGNSFSTTVDDIVVDTRDTPVSIARDVGSFSPNSDGSVDTVRFEFTVPVTEGISEWRLDILDSSDTVRRTATIRPRRLLR